MPKKTKREKFAAGPFAYHEEIELRIDTLTNLGAGLGRHGGTWVVMVPGALPGELVKARIYRNHANYSEGDLVNVLEPSPDRVEPVCSLFGQCGGCQYQNLSYRAQLAWKRRQVGELLEKMAGIEFPVDEVTASPKLYGYRSKITPHFQKPKNGEAGPIGFLLQGRRQEVIDVPHCPLATETLNRALTEVRREVRARARSYRRGATLLLRESLGGRVCTDPAETCEARVGDLTFAFQAGEFFQNNPFILPDFVEHVRSEASADGAMEYLIDCYCGSGLFCLSGAGSFREAAGIEVSQASIDWAKRNAEANGIANCRFITGSAENIFAQVPFPASQSAVVIDPPRKGSSPEFLAQLLRYRPARIVYVSCDPATQIRDLAHLRDQYRITRIKPFDLFPQTRHLECVVTLEALDGSEAQLG